MLHRGDIVEKYCRSSKISITDIARVLKVDRRTIYNWFSEPELSLDKIVKIGKVIYHDFSEDIPDLRKFETVVNDSISPYKKHNTLEECEKDLAILRGKYYELLEENRELRKQIEGISQGGPNSASLLGRAG